jgi:hypothetical protein
MSNISRVVAFIERIKLPTYIISIATLYISYFVIFFGIFRVAGKYIRAIQIAIQSIICIFLLIRFNPFMKPELKPYDSNIIFTSAGLLLTNVIIVEVGLSKSIFTDIPIWTKNKIGLAHLL